MIQIDIHKVREEISTIRVDGHAGYAQSGEDIICAAVSALTISLLNALEEVVGASFESQVDEGDVRLQVPRQQDEKRQAAAQVLLQSFALAAQNLARENPIYVTCRITGGKNET